MSRPGPYIECPRHRTKEAVAFGPSTVYTVEVGRAGIDDDYIEFAAHITPPVAYCGKDVELVRARNLGALYALVQTVLDGKTVTPGVEYGFLTEKEREMYAPEPSASTTRTVTLGVSRDFYATFDPPLVDGQLRVNARTSEVLQARVHSALVADAWVNGGLSARFIFRLPPDDVTKYLLARYTVIQRTPSDDERDKCIELLKRRKQQSF